MVEVDSDPDNFYEKLLTEEEQETLEVEPKQAEYIFLIDRSGSMSGQPIKLAV